MRVFIEDGQVNVKIEVDETVESLVANVPGGVSDGLWHTVSLYLEQDRLELVKLCF